MLTEKTGEIIAFPSARLKSDAAPVTKSAAQRGLDMVVSALIQQHGPRDAYNHLSEAAARVYENYENFPRPGPVKSDDPGKV